MKRLTLKEIIIGVLFIIGISTPVQAQNQRFLITYQIEFHSLIPKDIFLPFPLQLPEQQVLDYTVYPSNLRAELFYDTQFGNPIVHILNTNSKVVKVSYLVERKDLHIRFRSVKPYKAYPFKQYFVIKPTPAIKKMAQTSVKGIKSPLQRVKKLYNLVINFMRYNKHHLGAGKGDLNYILHFHQGNCIDYHSLFMALCGSIGIPTMFEIGLVVPQGQSGYIKGYHSWVKVFLPECGFIPVDISEADKHPRLKSYFFGNLPSNRITMSRGRFLEITPDLKHINFFIKPITLPRSKIRLKISFRKTP